MAKANRGKGGSLERGSPFLFMFFRIPLPLAVEAATVLLAVQLHRLGDVAAVRITLAEVGI